MKTKIVTDSYPDVFQEFAIPVAEDTSPNEGNRLVIKTRLRYKRVGSLGLVGMKNVTLERVDNIDFDSMKKMARQARETNPDLALDITAMVKL